MTSNFNSNRRTQEYSFKSKVFDDYPNTNINSINLDVDNGWLDNSPVTPRTNTTRRLDSQSIRSSNFNDGSTKSKDEFTIFGSFVRQKSERKSGISPSERTRTVPRQNSSYKNLPVKSPHSQDFTTEYTKIIKTENVSHLQSQPKYAPQTTLSPDSLFDLIQSTSDVDNSSFSNNAKSANEFSMRVPVDQEPIVAQQKKKVESSFFSNPNSETNFKMRVPVDQEPIETQRKNKVESSFPTQSLSMQLSADDSLENKDREISKLQKSIESKNKKLGLLKDNNEKLQEHIKNLLNERKQLLHQIENTEFEEIIEEEEVQEAKPNYTVREVVKPMEVSHDNCIQRGKITLEDLPSRLLDHYRNEIIHQIREQKEIEHRTAIDTLKLQQQKKLSDLQAEYESLKRSSIIRGNITINDLPSRMLESYREQIISQVKEQTETERRSVTDSLQMQQQKKLSDLQAEYESLKKSSIHRGKITIEDLPSRMLDSYREQIISQLREQTETEKRALIETLRMQQQKKLAELQAEYETVQKVSVQSIKKTRFNQIVSETNIQKAPSPKPQLASVGVNVSPVAISKQCQYDTTESRSSLNKFIAKKSLTAQQSSILDKILNSAENSNYEDLLDTIGKYINKPSTSIGINSTPIYNTRTTNTSRAESVDVAVEFNAPIEVIKKAFVATESRSIMVKPILLQRGCQPEDTFKFETGTMTDQIFCRSQGMMTVFDYPDYRSPINHDLELVGNRSTSRSESRKQTISQTTFIASPTKDVHQERSLSPRISKPVQKFPETVMEDILEIKTFKVESKPKPINIIEEVKHVVEEKTHQVTSVLDQNKVPKPEIPTTIECWETISHLKDGEVIDKTETYHDQLVSTDAEKIKEHLDRFNLSHSTEVSPTAKYESESMMKFDEKVINTKTTENKSIPIKIQSKDPITKSNVTETKIDRYNSTSSTSFGKPSAKETTYIEQTIVSSGIKKPLNFKETKSYQNVSLPIQREKTLLSEIAKAKETKTVTESKPVEVKEIKVDKNSVTPSFKRIGTETFSSNIKKSSDIKEINIERKSSVPTKVEVKSHSSVIKEPVDNKEKKMQQNLSSSTTEKTVYAESEETFSLTSTKKPVSTMSGNTISRESEHNFISSIVKEPEVFKEIKVQQSFSEPSSKETFSKKMEQSFNSTSIKRPVDIKEITVEQTHTAPVVEKTIVVESEQTFSSSSTKKPMEIKEIKVQQNYSTPPRQSENTITSSSVLRQGKEITVQSEMSLPRSKESTYQESENTIVFSNMRKPTTVMEVKVQPSKNETTYYESEHSYNTSIVNDSNNIRGERIFSNPSATKTTVYNTKQIFNSDDLNTETDIKVQQKYSAPIMRETTYEETEQTITYTTTTSSMPVTLESATNIVQSRLPSSIGVLTSPKAFQSYSSNKGRSNFSTSKMENYSFESDERNRDTFSKSQSIPINVKGNASTELTGNNIPVIDLSSSSIASSKSAFHSLTSSTEQKKSSISKSNDNFPVDVSQILLSENIFKSCTELLLWLKTTNLVTTSTIDYLPSNLTSVSSTLIAWWVDLTTTMDSSRLMATVQYLTTTFSKNLLKYLIINLDQQGNTCLHYIIGHQMWESFSVLESTKLIDPNIYNSQGYTVLMVSCSSTVTSDSGRENLRRLALIANVNLTSKMQGQTAIFIAALHNNSYMIQMLFTLGADINIRDNDDNTPLMVACAKNHIDAVTTILSWSGVLIDLKNKDGKTAFDIAQEAGFSQVLELFHQRKATKASEISSYSRIIQNSYNTSRSYGAKKY